jgi:hypothetical protein
VIYSRWRADGGYDYYQTDARHGLGDDLPTPGLVAVNAIGVPSTTAGRTMPASARWVGRGAIARGQVAPLDRTGIGLGAFTPSVGDLGFLVMAALFGWWLRGQLQQELAR